MLALLPGTTRELIESALGVSVEWFEGPSEFLAALGERPWLVALLSLDHEAVDERLRNGSLSPIAQAPSS